MTTKYLIPIVAGIVVIFGFLLFGSINADPKSQVTGPASSGAITGQDIPEITGYVNDGADAIDAKAELAVTQKLEAFSKSGHGEMAVVTVKSLNGLSVEEFGIRLAEKWKVGKAGKDDGVIIIISSGDRDVRIEVGRGANITDAQAGKILDDVMVPKLKSGDWSGAVASGVDSLIALISK